MTTNNSADKAGENPVGSICRYDFTAPTNYLECDGSCVSETTYAKLFDVVGNEYEAAIGFNCNR